MNFYSGSVDNLKLIDLLRMTNKAMANLVTQHIRGKGRLIIIKSILSYLPQDTQ